MKTITYTTDCRRITFRLDKVTFVAKDLESKSLVFYFDNGTNITMTNEDGLEKEILNYWEMSE